tara:strand:- start:97 stop:504 length:408 start_codon:yes stop_codon:yes gene_type:complete
MVMISQQQQKPINLSNPFSGITNDPVMQQGLLGNWAFNMANKKGNGGRSYFENFANFPQQNQNGNVLNGMQNNSAMNIFGQQNNNSLFQGWSDKLLSAYDSHVSTPNLQADILFNDTYMGGNNNKKQDVGWGLLG